MNEKHANYDGDGRLIGARRMTVGGPYGAVVFVEGAAENAE
jgi:hypothetical protein